MPATRTDPFLAPPPVPPPAAGIPWRISGALHGLTAALALAAAFWPRPPEKPPEHTFRLVGAPAAAAPARPAEAPNSADARLALNLPPAPRPVQARNPTPPPTPAPARANANTPARPADPNARPTTFGEFRQTQPPPRNQTARQPDGPRVTPPRIDTAAITRDLENFRTPARAGSLSPAEASALDLYLTGLWNALQDVWQEPASPATLVATARFTLQPDGRLANARLDPGSGDAAFDASVLAALRAVRGAGAVPGGQAMALSLTFRTRGQ